MTGFFMKIIKRPGERLVAACDKEVINLELDCNGVMIRISSKFYGEELVDERDLVDAIRNCTSANVIGIKIIELLVKNRFIHEEAILWLDYPNEKTQKIGHAILIK